MIRYAKKVNILHRQVNTDTFVRKINVVMQSKKPQMVQALGMDKIGNIVNTH